MKEWRFSAKVTRVVDGDTLDLLVDLGFRSFQQIRVRLANIDVYETTLRNDQTQEEKDKGIAAKCFMIYLLQDKEIEIVTYMDTGSFGRWLADVYYNGKNVCDFLREKGYERIK